MIYIKRLCNFLKIPFKDLNYSWKWYKISVIFCPFVAIAPFIGNFVNKFMYTFYNGQCGFFSTFGFLCPGCGLTRATITVSKGKFLSSFLFHPIPMYGLLVFSFFFIKNLLCICSDGKIKSLEFKDWWVYVALVLVILNCIIKNILFFNGIEMNDFLPLNFL